MTTFTSLLYGAPYQDPVTLYEDDNCLVEDTGSVHRLSLKKNWLDSMVTLAERFGVTRIDAMHLHGWDDRSIEFLDLLPNVTDAFIQTDRSLDWRPLERHPKIERVTLMPQIPVYAPSRVVQGEIDFTRMASLKVCDISWIPEWDSFRHASQIEALAIGHSWELRELDLSRLHNLSELKFEFCSELRKVVILDDFKIRLLFINASPKLKIDLKRFVRNLEYLWLGGKIAFPLDDLGKARNLKFLTLMFLKNRKELPPFLHELTALEVFLATSTRLSESDRAIEQKFIAKRKPPPDK